MARKQYDTLPELCNNCCNELDERHNVWTAYNVQEKWCIDCVEKEASYCGNPLDGSSKVEDNNNFCFDITALKVMQTTHDGRYVCWACFNNDFVTCRLCNTAFIYFETQSNICPTCLKSSQDGWDALSVDTHASSVNSLLKAGETTEDRVRLKNETGKGTYNWFDDDETGGYVDDYGRKRNSINLRRWTDTPPAVKQELYEVINCRKHPISS